MIVLHHPATLLHETVELLGARLHAALESPDRLRSILKALEHTSHLIKECDISDTDRGSLQKLLLESHDAGYIEHLRTAHNTWVAQGLIEEGDSILPECFHLGSTSIGDRAYKPPKDVFARPGFYSFDMSTGICKDTWAAIEASAFLASNAAKMLASSPESKEDGKSIMALCRPPGHHCNATKAGGYCYVNNAVVAVQTLRSYSEMPKIAILDLDFHHGNGTQDYFYDDPSILYVSIHGKDEFPYYSGFEDEKGRGSGLGFNVNLPLEVGASIERYLEKLDVAVDKIKSFDPKYMIISLGFDTFMVDPLGKFDIDTEDYETIAKRVRGAPALQSIPTAILLVGCHFTNNPHELTQWHRKVAT